MKAWLLFFPAFVLTIGVSWIGLVFVPHLQLGSLEPVTTEETGSAYPPVRSGEANVGAEVYRSLGCQYCHTRQVRSKSMGADIERGWGNRRTVARDYIRDQPVMLGNVRFGPDLANLGSRETNSATLLLKIYKPRATVPFSPMPSYPELFDVRRGVLNGAAPHVVLELPTHLGPGQGFEVVPRAEARALAAYLLSLKADELFLEAYPRTSTESGLIITAVQ